MTSTIPVYLNRSQKLTNLALIAVILALPTGLFLWGWYQSDTTVWFLLTAFGVFVSGSTLLIMRKSLFSGSKPVFLIRADGIEVVPNKTLYWSMFKEAVVFTYEGDKMIGLRLRTNLSPAEQIDLHTRIRNDMHFQLLKFPLTVLFDGLTLSGEEILQEFQEHGLPVCLFDQDVHFGHESVLHESLIDNTLNSTPR